jgi:hypothetical protein
LPVYQAKGINTRHRRLDRPLILDVLIGDEGLGDPLIFRDLGGEHIARISSDENLVTVVVVHIGSIGANAHSKSVQPRGQFNKGHGLDGKFVGMQACSRNARKQFGHERHEDRLVLVENIEDLSLPFKIDLVDIVSSAGVWAGQCLVGYQGAFAVG